MSYPRKLSDAQVAELAVYAMQRKGRNWPEPIKRTAHRYGVGLMTMHRYLKRVSA
jgi:hypothetical protein